jgi:demethylmenaquinone methyltransferase/2-methoxy-6-polyprenyl-1,4-benzoquinol methylase
MPPPVPQDAPGRFAPHAAREMASMFDDVSGRYDLLNRLMTLGRDRAWRAQMWRAVPESARTVLDLCTGNGVSLPGLRRPGRLVLGIDVSLAMLSQALERFGRVGWAPRLTAADAFRLPLRTASLDAITIAFGVRNLRPRREALEEIARVLRPGGTVAVLEAAAPGSGWFAPLHTFHLRHVVPLAGRLSPDPSAYHYLSRSIFEFGPGEEFERELDSAGIDVVERRAFLMGATRLWVGTRRSPGAPRALHNASFPKLAPGEMPQSGTAREREWRWWVGAQLVTSIAVLGALIYGSWIYRQVSVDLPLPPWQRRGLGVLLVAGILGFAVRTALLAARLLGPPQR